MKERFENYCQCVTVFFVEEKCASVWYELFQDSEKAVLWHLCSDVLGDEYFLKFNLIRIC
jgi:hypothetical protein